MSRLEHYAGQDEIGLRYNSHRTKREEYLVMSGDEFMERFSWHVADKGFRMVRYYGFLSPAKRRLLEEVVYIITETVRKTAMQITRRGMYAKWHLNRSQFGIRIDHDLAFISDHSLASQSITIWHASDH